MTRPATDRPARTYFWSIVCFAVLVMPRCALANGHDLPTEIVLQGFVKPEDDRVQLLVRVPLVLLTSFALPKRGPGYLDLASMDERLQQAAASTGRQIGLQEDGVDLVPAAIKGRISLPSDRSFASYDAALAHLEGPPLPADTDLFWNQGFFDAHLEYPIRSARGHFSISVNVAPELGERLKLQLRFLPIEGPSLTYKLPGDSGRITLDPRWYEASWLYLKVGFVDVFAVDRLVFLLCLIAPFRQFRSLLAVVLVMSALQALTATAIAQGALVDSPLLAAIFSTTLPAAIVLVAIGNLGAPRLRRRCLIGAIVGAVSGFSLGHMLADAMQFSGAHPLVSTASFNVGAVLGQAVSFALVWQAQRLLFARVLGPALGLVVLSAVLGHAGWHRMVEQGHDLMHALEHLGAWSALALVGPWMLPALVAGALAYLLPAGFGGAPVRSLLAAMLDASADERPARAA